MIQKHCIVMQIKPGMVTEFDGNPFPSMLVPMMIIIHDGIGLN